MIDGVGKGGAGRIDIARQDKGNAVGGARGADPRFAKGAVKSELLELVSGRAPVDSAKVEAVRTAIREGRYPLDPNRIALRMLDVDLPRRG
jgi:negative regulator of flagellin synthesis FlgM